MRLMTLYLKTNSFLQLFLGLDALVQVAGRILILAFNHRQLL